MANTRISNLAAIDALDAFLALLNVGGAGTLVFLDGSIPATCEIADAGTSIGILTLNATAFQGAIDGTDKATAQSNSITGETSATAGTISYFRAKNNAGTCILQGDVTVSAGGGDIELDVIVISGGDTIDVTDWDWEFPET